MTNLLFFNGSKPLSSFVRQSTEPEMTDHRQSMSVRYPLNTGDAAVTANCCEKFQRFNLILLERKNFLRISKYENLLMSYFLFSIIFY